MLHHKKIGKVGRILFFSWNILTCLEIKQDKTDIKESNLVLILLLPKPKTECIELKTSFSDGHFDM